MNSSNFLSALENILSEGVTSNYPNSWNEDQITYSILDGIRREFGKRIVIEGFRENMKIQWEFWKHPEKKSEFSYEDLAFVVDILHKDGDRLEGVAFIEAKKRHRDKTTFEAWI